MGKSTQTEIGYLIRKGEETRDVIRIKDRNRQSGTYILGLPDQGKSSFLQTLIHQDIVKGYPVIVLDPHGDLVDHVIAQLPEDHVSRTYLLDLKDCRDYPFSLNLFHCPNPADAELRDATRNQVIDVFDKIWHSEATQLNLPMLLRNIIGVLIENPAMTMFDIYNLLQDSQYRQQKTRHIKEPSVQAFWNRYNRETERKQQELSAPFVTRLDKFLSESIISNIMCQKDAKVNIRKAIEERKIILIKLPMNVKAYKESAEIIGTVLLSLIVGAAFSFEDTEWNKRPGFSLYVDEFYHFSTDSFAELYTEARKYGARLTIANQNRSQVTGKNSAATLGTDSIISFKIIDEDARKMAPYFFDSNITLKPQPIYRDVIKHLQSYHSEKDDEYQAVQDFYKYCIKPLLEAPKKKPNEDGLVECDFGDGIFYGKPTLFEKINLYLEKVNAFFYASQVNEYPDEALYAEVIKEACIPFRFGFYYLSPFLAREITNQIAELQKTSDEQSVTRAQEIAERKVGLSNRDQKRLLIEKERYDRFTQRLFFASIALIKHPLGEERTYKESDVVRILTNLPKRHAFINVRGETDDAPPRKFQIKTLDAPQATARDERLQARTQRIRTQTRAKYCRPVAEVEAALRGERTADPQNKANSYKPSPIELPEEERPARRKRLTDEDETL